MQPEDGYEAVPRITFFEESAISFREQLLRRQLLGGQGEDTYKFSVSNSRLRWPLSAVSTMSQLQDEADAYNDKKLEDEADAAMAGEEDEDDNAGGAEAAGGSVDLGLDDELQALLSTAKVAAGAAAAGGASSAAQKRKALLNSGKTKKKRVEAKLLSKAEETLMATFRTLCQEIEYTSLLEGIKLGKARFRAKELLPKLAVAGFTTEEDQMKAILENAVVCEAMSSLNVGFLSAPEYNQLSLTLKELEVVVPHSTGLMYVKRQAKWLAEEPNRLNIFLLVTTLRLKLAIGEESIFDPSKPLLACLSEVDEETRFQLHHMELRNFVLSSIRRGEGGVDMLGYLDGAFNACNIVDAIDDTVVADLQIAYSVARKSCDELQKIQQFMNSKKNPVAAAMRNKEPYVSNIKAMSEQLIYAESTAPKIAATMQLLGSTATPTLEVARQGLKDLNNYRSAAPQDCPKVRDALVALAVLAADQMESTEFPLDDTGMSHHVQVVTELYQGLQYQFQDKDMGVLKQSQVRANKAMATHKKNWKTISFFAVFSDLPNWTALSEEEAMEEAVDTLLPWDKISEVINTVAGTIVLETEAIFQNICPKVRTLICSYRNQLADEDMPCSSLVPRLAAFKRLTRMIPVVEQQQSYQFPHMIQCWENLVAIRKSHFEFLDAFSAEDVDKKGKALDRKAKVLKNALDKNAHITNLSQNEYLEEYKTFKNIQEAGLYRLMAYCKELQDLLEDALKAKCDEGEADDSPLKWNASLNRAEAKWEELLEIAEAKLVLTEGVKDILESLYVSIRQALAGLETFYETWVTLIDGQSDELVTKAKGLQATCKITVCELAIIGLAKQKAGKAAFVKQRKDMQTLKIEPNALMNAVREKLAAGMLG